MTSRADRLRAYVLQDNYPLAGAQLMSDPWLQSDSARLMLEHYARGHAAARPLCEQQRRFLARCDANGLDIMFPPDSEHIDPLALAPLLPLMNDADAHEASYDATADDAALEACVGGWETVLAHPSVLSAHPALRSALENNAGGAALKAYLAGLLPDPDRATAHLRESVSLTPLGSPRRPTRLSNLGSAQLEAARLTGDAKAVDAAVAVLRRAVPPGRSTSLAVTTTNLSRGLIELHGVTRDVNYLTEAVRRLDFTTAAVGPSLGVTVALGQALRLRYEAAGDAADLDRALSNLEQVQDLGGLNAQDQLVLANAMAITLLDVHRRDGEDEQLRAAIDLLDLCAELADHRSPTYAGIIAQTGLGYYRAFEVWGQLADLDTALERLAAAANTAHQLQLDRPLWLIDYAAALERRAAFLSPTAAMTELNRAVALAQEARDLLPEDSAYRSVVLGNLGNAYRTRHRLSGDTADLERAVEQLSGAVRLVAAEGARDRPAGAAEYQVNLGLAQADLAFARRDRRSAEQAVETLTTAPAVGGMLTPTALTALASAYAVCFDLDGGAEDRRRALSLYAEGCAAAESIDPTTAVVAAEGWSRWCAEHAWWDEAAQGCRMALRALRRLAALQPAFADRQGWVRLGPTLGAEGAFAEARRPDLEGAVELLESGRAIAFADSFAERETTLGRLGRSHPELAARYRSAASQSRNALPALGGPAVVGH